MDQIRTIYRRKKSQAVQIELSTETYSDHTISDQQKGTKKVT